MPLSADASFRLTREWMAAKGIVLDQTAISRIENQTRYLMDYEIVALARCLKVSVAWLFGESDRP